LVVWSSIVYRLVNRVDTFKSLNGIPSMNEHESYLEVLNTMAEEGVSVFTEAHEVIGFIRYCELVEAISENDGLVLGDFVTAVTAGGRSLADLTSLLEKLPNVDGFVSWQVTCDLLESGILEPRHTENEYVALSPGAVEGLCDIFGSSENDEERRKLVEHLCDIQQDAFAALRLTFPYFDGRLISMKNMERCLGEYYKYVSIFEGSLFKTRPYTPSDVGSGNNCKLCIKKDCYNLQCATCQDHYCYKCIGENFCQNCVPSLWFCPGCKGIDTYRTLNKIEAGPLTTTPDDKECKCKAESIKTLPFDQLSTLDARYKSPGPLKKRIPTNEHETATEQPSAKKSKTESGQTTQDKFTETLPEGWFHERTPRSIGDDVYHYWYDPSRKYKFRSMREVRNYLERGTPPSRRNRNRTSSPSATNAHTPTSKAKSSMEDDYSSPRIYTTPKRTSRMSSSYSMRTTRSQAKPDNATSNSKPSVKHPTPTKKASPAIDKAGQAIYDADLPTGWTKTLVAHSSEAKSNFDKYWFSPKGHKFRSKAELARYLGLVYENKGDETESWNAFKETATAHD